MSVQDRYPDFLKDQRQFFDELIVEDWDTYQSKEWDLARSFEIKKIFKKIQPVNILNIGCGCGWQDQHMAQYPFVQKVDSIDYSPKSVEVANRVYPHPKVKRTVNDFKTFTSAHPYDLIISFSVFEHLANFDEYFQFCVRNSAPLGAVSISTVNRLRLRSRVRLLQRKSPCLEDPMHFKEYTIKELAKLGETFGLKAVDSFGFGLYDYPLFGIKGGLLGGHLFPFIASRINVIYKLKKAN